MVFAVIIIAVIVVLLTITGYACCVAAGRADDIADECWKKMQKSKNDITEADI